MDQTTVKLNESNTGPAIIKSAGESITSPPFPPGSNHPAFMPEPPAESVPLPPDRREFLAGQPLRERVAAALTTEPPNPNLSSLTAAAGPAAEDWLQEFSHRAMGSEFQVLLNLGQYTAGPAAVLAGFALVDQLEDRFSIFRPDSELSQINQLAAATDLPIESDLFGLLEMATTLHRETQGAFDLATTALSRTWNFLSRNPQVPAPEAIAAALATSGQQHLVLDSTERSVRLLKQGVELNLHSVGKGFALGQLARHLELAGIRDFLLHGGQSSVLARGSCLPVERNQPGWRIGLTHPVIPEQRIAELLLVNQAIGTSGSARQGLVHRGQRLGHILDPRTGWPASHWLSTTVIHPDAAWADALATAFFVMTEKEVANYCETHPEIAAILTVAREPGSRLELRLFRFPAERLELNPEFRYVALTEVLPSSPDPDTPQATLPSSRE